MTRSFDVFFDLRLNKGLSKQSRGWWFVTPSCTLWRHCNGGFDNDDWLWFIMIMIIIMFVIVIIVVIIIVTTVIIVKNIAAAIIIKTCLLLICFSAFQFTYLTHWGRDKMDAISQTTCSSAFSWMKMFEFRMKFHWSLFLRVQLTIIQHCFR